MLRQKLTAELDLAGAYVIKDYCVELNFLGCSALRICVCLSQSHLLSLAVSFNHIIINEHESKVV